MTTLKIGMKHSTTATYGNCGTVATITAVYTNTWGDFVDMILPDGGTISMYPQDAVNVVE